MAEWIIHDLSELDAMAIQLLGAAAGRKVFAFMGPVGAGKTTFIQAICRQLGVVEPVSSPTFALVNEYAGPVYHLDLYRLESLEEALDIGIEEYLYSGNYCFVEWPLLAKPLLPEDTWWIEIIPMADGSRKLLFL